MQAERSPVLRRGGVFRGSALRRPMIAALLAGLSVLASPPSLGGEEENETCRDDAILVFDASGSMASTDPHGNVSRIHRVRQAAAVVVPSVAPVRNLGLMIYGGGETNGCSDIALKVPPAPDNAGPILLALRDVLPNGRTPLTEAVSRAAEALNFRKRPATIILLTDGEESCGGDPCKLANRLHSEGARTRVHVIDYKSRFGSDWRGTLQSQCLAQTTGGRYIAVNAVDDLIAALREMLSCPYVTERSRDLAPQSLPTP